MNNNSFFYFWLKNLRTSFLLIMLIVLAWSFSLYSIPKESSPDIKFGLINIAVTYPWVNPEDMDALITEEIESSIEDIDWIKKITSTSSVWSSLVVVELETWVDTRDILTDIKDDVDKVDLPEDASDPVVIEVSSNNTLIYEALIYWDSNLFDDFTIIQKAKSIKWKLDWVAGISTIDLWWLDNLNWWASMWWKNDYDIKVLLSKSKLELLWLSIIDISNTIKANNKDTPIWNFRVWELSYDFRFEWELKWLNDLKNIVLKDNWVSQIFLSDIADIKIEYAWDTIKRLGFFGESWMNYTSLTFNKATWANVFDSSENSKEALENLLENDIEFKWLHVEYSKDMSAAIIKDYDNLSTTAITTIILVFLTILFFVWFKEWIIASLLIPLAFFITFIVLDTFGLSMNFLTNFSLVLTLWIAIDTVIVIIEWASEKMRLWFSRKSAIILAVRDFKSPLISGTSTTLVAFLPLIFLPWIVWKFLSFIPITVFITLIAALFLSLTLASALFVTLMSSKKTYHKEEKIEKNMREEDLILLKKDREFKIEKELSKLSLRERFLNTLWILYEKTLYKIFSKTIYKISFVLIPVILLIFSFVFLSPKIGFVLFPSTDEWIINISIEWQVWSKEDSMVKYLPILDDILSKREEIKVYYTTISWNSISIYIDLLDVDDRTSKWLLGVFDLEKELEDKMLFLRSEWLDLTVAALKWWPPTWSAVWVKLTSLSANDFDLLKSVSEDFEYYLKSLNGSKNIISTSSDAPWQFVFEFDKKKLSNIWLNQSDILNQLYFYTNWIKSGSIKNGTEDNEIILLFKEFENSLNPEDIENLVINTKVWKIVVWDFADFTFKKSVNNISREDWKIIISVWSEVQEWFLPTDIQPILDKFAEEYVFPEWISYIKWWESEENKDLIISTIKSLFIALFLIFSILVFQFNSFRQPIIVLYSIILALLWVNIWLYVTWNPYSMPFWIWFIALTWIVVNDAIILIDKINKSIKTRCDQADGNNIDYLEQLVLSWKSRLQPIIVTTLTTVFWVLPLALQDEFWAGLGFTIIFWLFVWSFMTLVVVPILYQILVIWKIKK